ncbi:23S rRNA (uracil(747)-C(5))-methyltransferase RlmC [Nocardioides jiangxiensis]|uniref:23S rRNA (Uracil(747)-C(5))-methyltransferase RlmC n=1 Tax=Nocardioides jiangxiensis TaxID=3064524 RepID=A0ABT9B2V4_9ACTN|nr:23S rRNA (uracil(747)-C(5))-methyltransferase RlmC [Nocardioides sp. WY-20]MDO7867616.1 23S rRNA (uracil(747)-C(5))-methyltransferase RlmC [Nocardioides sp. WY-20]
MSLSCHHFDAGRCGSCALLPTPYADQLAAKQAAVRALLDPVAGGVEWLPPVASAESGFRNKAKMVVTGTSTAPVLGILAPAGSQAALAGLAGIDLRDCALHTPGIVAAMEVLAAFIARADLAPYDLGSRRGELKHVIVTESPDSELMVRFVLRSQEPVARIRKHLPWLLEALPAAAVVSLNLQPAHKAVLEGEREIVLHGSTLTMRLNGLPLHLRPQGFFQTNTGVAAALYAQATEWVEDVAPGRVLDLYCGVGGFALHAARGASSPVVTGIEISEDAVAAARRTAEEMGLSGARFEAGDATTMDALLPTADLVVVNPPRRGIGPLAAALEASPVRDVVYSSCNALSLARDLAAMPSLRPVRARLLDMFPHTGHYEVVTHLTRH